MEYTCMKKSNTLYGFSIVSGTEGANHNKAMFHDYYAKQINFDELKRRFMRFNEIEKLNDIDFADWMKSLGWRLSRADEVRIYEIKNA